MTDTTQQKPCDDYEELIFDEAVGELTAEETKRLASHVAHCEHCSAARAHLRKALLQTRSLFVPEPSADYWDHFIPRLRDRIATSQRSITVDDVRRKLEEKRRAGGEFTSPPPPSPPPRPAPRILGPRAAWIGVGLAAALLLLVLSPALLTSEPAVPAPTVADLTPAPDPVPDLEPLPLLPPAAADEESLYLVEGSVEEMEADLDAMIDELSPEELARLDQWLDERLRS